MKLRVGMLVGYIGTRYFGMQVTRRPESRSVEDCVENALKAAGYAKNDDERPLKIARCSRTDKSVHAALNMIALKIIVKPGDLLIPLPSAKNSISKVVSESRDLDQNTFKVAEGGNKSEESEVEIGDETKEVLKVHLNRKLIVENINKLLDDDIRVYGFRLVSKRLDPRFACGMRTYEYLLPLFVIVDPCQSMQKDASISLEKLESLVKELADLSAGYEGVHNFHNFTSEAQPHEQRNKRKIKSFKVSWCCHSRSETELQGGEIPINQVYLRFTLEGVSFMFHQIRRMVGLLVQIHTGVLKTTIPDTSHTENLSDYLTSAKRYILTAPAEGLFLSNMKITPRVEEGQETFTFTPPEQEAYQNMRQRIEQEIRSKQSEACHRWLKEIRDQEDMSSKLTAFEGRWRALTP